MEVGQSPTQTLSSSWNDTALVASSHHTQQRHLLEAIFVPLVAGCLISPQGFSLVRQTDSLIKWRDRFHSSLDRSSNTGNRVLVAEFNTVAEQHIYLWQDEGESCTDDHRYDLTPAKNSVYTVELLPRTLCRVHFPEKMSVRPWIQSRSRLDTHTFWSTKLVHIECS